MIYHILDKFQTPSKKIGSINCMKKFAFRNLVIIVGYLFWKFQKISTPGTDQNEKTIEIAVSHKMLVLGKRNWLYDNDGLKYLELFVNTYNL